MDDPFHKFMTGKTDPVPAWIPVILMVAIAATIANLVWIILR